MDSKRLWITSPCIPGEQPEDKQNPVVEIFTETLAGWWFEAFVCFLDIWDDWFVNYFLQGQVIIITVMSTTYHHHQQHSQLTMIIIGVVIIIISSNRSIRGTTIIFAA